MPTGTGKTICLLSLITSYQAANPDVGKLVYCTRTVQEMSKTVAELKNLMRVRQETYGEKHPFSNILGLCLSSRRNMCINETVMGEGQDLSRESVDAQCRTLTAPWVRQKRSGEVPTAGGGGDDVGNVESCSFFENYEQFGSDAAIPSKIYSIDDIKELGREKGWCPYYLARHILSLAKVIVYNYSYMLDPKVAGMVSRELEAESVIVFDEAHNIDNVCIEALSVELDERALIKATANVNKLNGEVQQLMAKDKERLEAEYRRLVNGLGSSGGLPAGVFDNGYGGGGDRAPNATAEEHSYLANPVLSQDILNEAVPGSVRRAEHFVSFMKRTLTHLKKKVDQAEAITMESPEEFLYKISNDVGIDAKPMKFAYSRLNSLLRTLEVVNLDEYNPLQDVADLLTLVATYPKGFMIILEPFDQRSPTIRAPKIYLACLDASLAIKPVIDRFKTVVITSGTLSPLDLYPKLLGFDPCVRQSFSMSIYRSCICPLVVVRGNDQQTMSTKYDLREDNSVVRNYGALVVEVAATVPDGVVVFFTSYDYMEKTIAKWDELGVLKQMLHHKLLFIETKDVVETTLALDNFKRACDCGRGAVFFSIARGKVAEGIDFDRHYGRCVIMIGVPFQYTLSHILRARLEWLRHKHNIKEGDFLTFDALRQASQCVGRVIRSKTDYGLVILADSRFNRHDKRDKLPKWVTQFLGDGQVRFCFSFLPSFPLPSLPSSSFPPSFPLFSFLPSFPSYSFLPFIFLPSFPSSFFTLSFPPSSFLLFPHLPSFLPSFIPSPTHLRPPRPPPPGTRKKISSSGKTWKCFAARQRATRPAATAPWTPTPSGGN
jgi:DNA excision repair protein ERCC-2